MVIESYLIDELWLYFVLPFLHSFRQRCLLGITLGVHQELLLKYEGSGGGTSGTSVTSYTEPCSISCWNMTQKDWLIETPACVYVPHSSSPGLRNSVRPCLPLAATL